jgi:hypothetical protein
MLEVIKSYTVSTCHIFSNLLLSAYSNAMAHATPFDRAQAGERTENQWTYVQK